jgi:YD repeat-containing protein
MTWPDRVTDTYRLSILDPTQTVHEQRTYDAATGATLTTSITGLTGIPAAAQTRTNTTALYGTESAVFNPYSSGQPAWYALAQPAGRVKSVDGPRSDVTDTTYFIYYPFDATTVPNAADRGQLAATKNAGGHITRYENYDVFGHATRVIDGNGVVTESSYDVLGRLTTITLKGIVGCDTNVDVLCSTDLSTSRAYYNTTGPVKSVTTPIGGYTEYSYDGKGRLETTKRGTAANALTEQIALQYDTSTGRKSEERILGYANGSWSEKSARKFEYTADGKLKRVFYTPFQTPITTGSYDETVFAPNGDVSGIKDARHSTPNQTYSYDAAGRIESVSQLTKLSTSNWSTTSYTYYVDGNVKTVTDPNGNVTTYTADDFGQTIRTVSAVSGTSSSVYDVAGNLITSTDANAASTSRTFDALNRLLTSTATHGSDSEAISWSYDTAGAGAFRTGRIPSMTDPTGTTTYSYDRRGLLRQESRSGGGTVTKYG